MAKKQPIVRVDVPLDEALDLVRAVKALQDRLNNQTSPLQGAQVIATHMRTVVDFTAAISAATQKAA